MAKNNMEEVKMGLVGVGGGGKNSVCNIYDSFEKNKLNLNLDYSIINTDSQDLVSIGNRKIKKILISDDESSSKGGMGAGADPFVGYKCMKSSTELLDNVFGDNDIIFLSLGLGGGTGSGATPVILEEAKKRGILTIVFTTFPWKFEGSNREVNARISLNSIHEFADSIIVVNNGYLYRDKDNDKPVLVNELFEKTDEFLKNTILAFLSLILERSKINIDLNDIKTALSDSKFGFCFIANYQPDRKNFDKISSSQKIEDISKEIKETYIDGLNLENSKYLVVNVAGREESLDMEVIEGVFENIKNNSKEIQIIFGLSFNPYMDMGEIQFTGIFTGVDYQTLSISKLIDPNKTFKKLMGNN